MAVELLAGTKIRGESKTAIIAANDYLRLGPSRSLRKLLELYQRQIADNQLTPPTDKWGTLSGWSVKYHWVERAESYDGAIEAKKNEEEKARQREIAERRKAIMESGVALDFERVERLKRLADFLEAQVFYEPQISDEAAKELGIANLVAAVGDEADDEELNSVARIVLSKLDPNDPKAKYPNIWARDVKALAGGRVVDVVRFNASILAELRATLDDLAKETGGRRQRVINENIDYSKLTEDQLARVSAGEDPIQVILGDYASN